MKYAYLIIANKNINQVKKLITMLDDSRNDIYLLWDKKSFTSDYYRLNTNYSSIYYLKPINIYWGSYSQIQAELNLFEASFHNDNYAYYHLLSGQDLPLTNQDYIHKFFDLRPNREFIQYFLDDKKTFNGELNSHLFINNFDDGVHAEHSTKILPIRLLFSIYRHLENYILVRMPERKIPINRVCSASQWISIDNQLVNIIINNKNWIYEKFHRGTCVDEIFIPSLINYYPKILNKVYDRTKYKSLGRPVSNLRYIKKNIGDAHPKIFTIKNYSELINARYKGYFFARKFDSLIDNDIVNKIFLNVMNS